MWTLQNSVITVYLTIYVTLVLSAGYEGDGVICTDINECTDGSHTCHADATCTNTPPGSFTCTCNSGYTGDGTSCTDIDECTANTDYCADTLATCANTYGRYTCTCIPGYEGDGIICNKIDLCATGAAVCQTQATCTNTPGHKFTCICNSGYFGDGTICTACDREHYGPACMGVCATRNCEGRSYCNSTTGRCDKGCQSGWTGVDCTEPTSISPSAAVVASAVTTVLVFIVVLIVIVAIVVWRRRSVKNRTNVPNQIHYVNTSHPAVQHRNEGFEVMDSHTVSFENDEARNSSYASIDYLTPRPGAGEANGVSNTISDNTYKRDVCAMSHDPAMKTMNNKQRNGEVEVMDSPTVSFKNDKARNSSYASIDYLTPRPGPGEGNGVSNTISDDTYERDVWARSHDPAMKTMNNKQRNGKVEVMDRSTVSYDNDQTRNSKYASIDYLTLIPGPGEGNSVSNTISDDTHERDVCAMSHDPANKTMNNKQRNGEFKVMDRFTVSYDDDQTRNSKYASIDYHTPRPGPERDVGAKSHDQADKMMDNKHTKTEYITPLPDFSGRQSHGDQQSSDETTHDAYEPVRTYDEFVSRDQDGVYAELEKAEYENVKTVDR